MIQPLFTKLKLMLQPKTYYSYENIRLIPEMFNGTSRSQSDISAPLGNWVFKTPLVPANMVCSIDINQARILAYAGHFYIMHRFHDILYFVTLANNEKWPLISISIGVKEQDQLLLNLIKAKNLRLDFVTIDVAHGHSIQVQQQIKIITQLFPNAVVIAGNVCTTEAIKDLSKWGADVIKVGIAQGGACTTHGKTGFGLPMFTCVQECAEAALEYGVDIIADGGIKTIGDISKAIVAGADFVMAGSMFAALRDSPAELTIDRKHKQYFGSASVYNGNTRHIEGTLVELKLNDKTYIEFYNEVMDDIASAISYSGGYSLNSLKFTKYAIAY